MPSLGGATGWLASQPLGPAEPRGQVVLVDFWTLTWINWLRTLANSSRYVGGTSDVVPTNTACAC